MNNRLNELRKRLAMTEIDAALLIHPRDVFYYTGTARPATLVVGPQSEALLVRRGVEYARQEATIDHIEAGGGFRRVAAVLDAMGLVGGALGVEMDVLSLQLAQRIEAALPDWQLTDVSPLVLDQRIVKDELEQALTRTAAAVADAGHAALARVLRPGMSELELAAQVEAAIRCAGHEGYQALRHPEARGGGIFLMSGQNLTVRGGHGLVITGAGLSPASPYGASLREVQPGDLVVLDIGSTYQGYTADESRTYVVGQATAAQQALFDVALTAQEALLEMLRPGTSLANAYSAAETVVAQGAPPHFFPGTLSLPGFAGHGIGLELDEPPVIWDRGQERVQEGMVLAIELEVNAPEVGMMAKMEDTVIIEANGPVLVTDAPRTLIEVPV